MTNKNTFSNIPPKGTADRFPQEFRIRKYIFDTWRRVCTSFGYEEYLTPLVENADIYRAKSGEDVGGPELTLINDRGGRDIAIRPEMTPSVTRMVTRVYAQEPKPIKRFSIANFYRNERPQRGRNREFRQLNVDVFGSTSIHTDIEILQLSIVLMQELGAPQDSFKLYCNHRGLIQYFLDTVLQLTDAQQKQEIVRLMDKREKLSLQDFTRTLQEKGLSSEQINKLTGYLQSETLQDLTKVFPLPSDQTRVQDMEYIQEQLYKLGYQHIVAFKASLIRGFDYYDGMIFEVFDMHPDNNRAMFGGGRYNGLANLFGNYDVPAVGFAPGDEPARLFLESRGVIEKILQQSQEEVWYFPLLDADMYTDSALLANTLRSQGRTIQLGTEVQNPAKAIDYALKRGYTHIIFYGSQEKSARYYKMKDLNTQEEKNVNL